MSAASFGTLLDLVSDGPPLGAVGLGVRRAIDPPDQPLIRLTLGAGGGDEGRDRAGPESDPGGVFWPGLRPPLPAWAMALRWMRRRIRKHSGGLFSRRRRQRCQVALRPFETAGLMPSWAAEITSFTPRRPRRVSLRRNSVQIGSASEVPVSKHGTSRRPSVFPPMAGMTATESWPLLRHWSERQWRPARRAGPRGRSHRSRTRASPLPAAG